MRTTAFLLLALLASVGCKNTDPTQPAKEAAGIEGTYLLTGIDMFGEKVPDDEIASGPEGERTATISKDTIRLPLLSMGDKGKERVMTYKLDPSKTPAEIQLTRANLKGEMKTIYGIYKLEGDTLTLLVTSGEGETYRPKEFKTRPKSLDMMIVLKKK